MEGLSFSLIPSLDWMGTDKRLWTHGEPATVAANGAGSKEVMVFHSSSISEFFSIVSKISLMSPLDPSYVARKAIGVE